MRKTDKLKYWIFQKKDSQEQQVKVPHDWAIYGPFDRANDNQFIQVIQDGEKKSTEHNGRTGGLPHPGEAVYRHTFTLSPAEKEQCLRFEFDGIMSHSEIFLNGRKIAERPCGYSSFAADASEAAVTGENLLEVRVANPPFSSRWYPGAGIYREVRKILLEKEHFLYSGIRISPEITDLEKHSGVVTVEAETSVADAEIKAEMEICGKKYSVTGSSPLRFEVSDIEYWSADTPVLYTLEVSLLREGKVKDKVDHKIGFRQIIFDADTGMTVNGRKETLKGVCLHHDLGPLGAAFNSSAMRHRLKLLESIGCNAIRTSHNMPDPKLLELCDELGFYVIDEAFDCWAAGKTPNDYHVEYPQWHERDLADFVKRDRNNPSVIMWSIGNEISEQRESSGADFVRDLKSIIRRFDSRPVTAGFDFSNDAIKNKLAENVDVAGWNYKPEFYQKYHKLLPGVPQYGSETASTFSTRGFYTFPAEEGCHYHEPYQCSSFDVEYPSWANTPDTEFQAQDQCPWILGEFVWTGFDYLGEPTPYNHVWPAHSSYFGIFDLGAIPKDRAYLYAARWGKEPVLHILPHWNWEEFTGKTIPVHVYTNFPAVELFVNGKSYGTRQARFGRVRFDDVIYVPGEVTACAKDAAGNTAAKTQIKTSGSPFEIRLTSDRSAMPSDDEELAFVTAEIVDKDGNLCPLYDGLLHFTVEGSGCYEASANGDPCSLEIFSAPEKHAFYGKCMIVVRSETESGVLRLRVSAENLQAAECEIKIMPLF